jgi:hypothetical protein
MVRAFVIGDTKGRMVILPQFDLAMEFYRGLASVEIGEKWLIVNRNGRFLTRQRFRGIGGFWDRLFTFLSLIVSGDT